MAKAWMPAVLMLAFAGEALAADGQCPPSPGPGCRARLVFDGLGRLSGSPPVVLESGPVPSPSPDMPAPKAACVEVGGTVDPEAAPAARKELRQRLQEASDVLSHRSLHRGPWAVWTALGFSPSEIEAYGRSVDRQACVLKAVEAGSPHPEDDCARVDPDPIKGLVVGFGTFQATLEGQVRSVLPTSVSSSALLPLPTCFDMSTEPALLRVEYDLRRRNPFATGLDAWIKGTPPPSNMEAALFKAALELREKAVGLTVRPGWQTLATCMDEPTLSVGSDTLSVPECPDLHKRPLAEVTKALEAATAEMGALQAEIGQVLGRALPAEVARPWLLRWAWYNSGIPRFRPLRNRDAEDLRARLTAARAALLELNGEVDALAHIMVRTASGAEAEDAARRLGAIQKQRDAAKAKVAALEEALAGSALEYDTLLYQGHLVASGTGTDELDARPGIRYPSAALNLMQHHDGSRDFVIMGRGVAAEIRETDRMFVLAENVPPEVQLRLTQTVTPIADDLTLEAEEALRSMSPAKAIGGAAKVLGHAEPEAMAHDDPRKLFLEARKNFLIAYAETTSLIAFASVELSAGGQDWEAKRDRTPALVTRAVPQDQPAIGPATVEYTLKRKDAGNETDVWKGSYRLNHLYRLRLQAGFLYSSLRTSDFPKKDDGTFGAEERGQHGVDLTFGTMVYLKRRDIRNATFEERVWPPAIYTGFSVREPLENVFLGLGFEILPSATLIVGPHIGRDESLVKAADGVQSLESKWRHKNWFVGVVFDPALFARVFGGE